MLSYRSCAAVSGRGSVHMTGRVGSLLIWLTTTGAALTERGFWGNPDNALSPLSRVWTVIKSSHNALNRIHDFKTAKAKISVKGVPPHSPVIFASEILR